jgi:hypothetical protein
MPVVPNYSGWEHNDREDFKGRVHKSLEKLANAAKRAKPAEQVIPGGPGK